MQGLTLPLAVFTNVSNREFEKGFIHSGRSFFGWAVKKICRTDQGMMYGLITLIFTSRL